MPNSEELSSLLFAVTSSNRFYPPPPPPPSLSKSGLKLVCNVKIVYGILKSENSQDYAQKPQRNSMCVNSASGKMWGVTWGTACSRWVRHPSASESLLAGWDVKGLKIISMWRSDFQKFTVQGFLVDILWVHEFIYRYCTYLFLSDKIHDNLATEFTYKKRSGGTET